MRKSKEFYKEVGEGDFEIFKGRIEKIKKRITPFCKASGMDIQNNLEYEQFSLNLSIYIEEDEFCGGVDFIFLDKKENGKWPFEFVLGKIYYAGRRTYFIRKT